MWANLNVGFQELGIRRKKKKNSWASNTLQLRKEITLFTPRKAVIAGSLRKHEDSGCSWGRKALRYLVHNSTKDRKLQYKKEKGRNQGKHKCALQLKIQTEQQQQQKNKVKPPPHFHTENLIKAEQSWCAVLQETGGEIYPIGIKGRTTFPQVHPPLPEGTLGHQYNVPSFVFHLMLPLGYWSLFSVNIKIRIPNKGFDLK